MTRRESVSGCLRATIATLALTALALVILPATASADSKPVWLCKPGKAHNPCEPGLNTTLITHSGEPVRVKDVKADSPRRIDCFYLYPTVSDQQTANANLHIDPEERSIALYQAARYSQHCRVFAPMYRQLTLKAIFDGETTVHQQQVAYRSALQGWRTYMAKYNNGRGVVLIGHSQGTFLLRTLIADEIDPDPQLRSQLVSALLLGGNVTVKAGGGGDFQHVPPCRSSTQLHCAIAFSTFNAPVPADAVFGRTTIPGAKILCTNPAALGGGSADLDTVLPSAPFAPDTAIGLATRAVGFPEIHDVSTPFVETVGAYSGQCSSADGANVLQLTDGHGAPHLRALPDATWGLHLTDANIALGDLVDVVHQQEAAYLAGGG